MLSKEHLLQVYVNNLWKVILFFKVNFFLFLVTTKVAESYNIGLTNTKSNPEHV